MLVEHQKTVSCHLGCIKFLNIRGLPVLPFKTVLWRQKAVWCHSKCINVPNILYIHLLPAGRPGRGPGLEQLDQGADGHAVALEGPRPRLLVGSHGRRHDFNVAAPLQVTPKLAPRLVPILVPADPAANLKHKMQENG